MSDDHRFVRTVGVALLLSLLFWIILAFEHNWRTFAPINPYRAPNMPFETVVTHTLKPLERQNPVNRFVQEIVLYWRVGN